MITIKDFIEPIRITNYSLIIGNLLVNRQAICLALSCPVYANLSIQETFDQQTRKKSIRSLVY